LNEVISVGLHSGFCKALEKKLIGVGNSHESTLTADYLLGGARHSDMEIQLAVVMTEIIKL